MILLLLLLLLLVPPCTCSDTFAHTDFSLAPLQHVVVVVVAQQLFSSRPLTSAIELLQHVLHAAAHFAGGLQLRDHVTATLMALRWLPVCQRITYKLCCLTHGVVYGHTPGYLIDMLPPHSNVPGRAHPQSAQ